MDFLVNDIGGYELNVKETFRAVWIILSANIHLVSINEIDFEEWFNELAEQKGPQKLLEMKSTENSRPSRFTKLVAKCARKCLHLSVPV